MFKKSSRKQLSLRNDFNAKDIILMILLIFASLIILGIIFYLFGVITDLFVQSDYCISNPFDISKCIWLGCFEFVFFLCEFVSSYLTLAAPVVCIYLVGHLQNRESFKKHLISLAIICPFYTLFIYPLLGVLLSFVSKTLTNKCNLSGFDSIYNETCIEQSLKLHMMVLFFTIASLILLSVLNLIRYLFSKIPKLKNNKTQYIQLV